MIEILVDGFWVNEAEHGGVRVRDVFRTTDVPGYVSRVTAIIPDGNGGHEIKSVPIGRSTKSIPVGHSTKSTPHQDVTANRTRPKTLPWPPGAAREFLLKVSCLAYSAFRNLEVPLAVPAPWVSLATHVACLEEDVQRLVEKVNRLHDERDHYRDLVLSNGKNGE